jgi:hypothetical protein
VVSSSPTWRRTGHKAGRRNRAALPGRESARSLADEYDVAPSALTRLLRERNIVVRQQVVTPSQEQMMAQKYEAGSAMADPEQYTSCRTERCFKPLTVLELTCGRTCNPRTIGSDDLPISLLWQAAFHRHHPAQAPKAHEPIDSDLEQNGQCP